MRKIIDMTGKKCGKWIVIKRLQNDKHNNTVYYCRCECGKFRNILGPSLRKMKSDSACRNCSSIFSKYANKPKHDLTQKKIFHLTALYPIKKKNIHRKNSGDWHWMCRCECGKEKLVIAHHLLDGTTKSCGCLISNTGNNSNLWKGFGEISGQIWKTYQNGAKRRNLEFSISIEDAWNLFLKQNRKCALTGQDICFSPKESLKSIIKTASLDRIDPNKGYCLTNVQWIHKDINWMKQDFDEHYFLKMCKMVVDHLS